MPLKKDRHLKVLMPMAGKGQRFKDQGTMTPKPLIPVLGKPMITWATMSLSFFHEIPPEDIIAVVRRDDILNDHIDREIKTIFGGASVLVDEEPRGAATTALVARDMINNKNPLLIMDCDIFFSSPTFEEIVTQGRTADGSIPVFAAKGNKWSFSAVDKNNAIQAVTEKNRVQHTNCITRANVGFYFFSRGEDFVHAASRISKKKNKEEYYISSVVNDLIREGFRFSAAACDAVHSLGTPEDLQIFISKRGPKNEQTT